MPRVLKETSQFKTDKKRIKGSGRYDWEKMRAVVKELMNDRPLDKKHRDHELSGEYSAVWECHFEPDWLLIYDTDGSVKTGTLKLIRTGTHSDLFLQVICGLPRPETTKHSAAQPSHRRINRLQRTGVRGWLLCLADGSGIVDSDARQPFN